jgi:hypothetical protein
MLWSKLQSLKPADFKRRVGVLRATFHKMVREVRRNEKRNKKHPKRRRPPKISLEDQVLLTLMYWREYRTMFHIATDYGLSESTVCRTINKVEDILSKSKAFKLPGKKVLSKSKFSYEVFLVDTTESPIERPKKNSNGITQGKRKSTP